MGYRIDSQLKKIVNQSGQPIGLPINDFGSRTELTLEGFTYTTSLSVALYLLDPDLRDGQTMPVYYGTVWTSANGAYTHTMKYGKEYYYGVTQNDTPARLVVVADDEVILDQEVLIDQISSYDPDAETLPTAEGGGGTTAAAWGKITGTLSAQTDLITALNSKAAQTDLSTLSGQVTTLTTAVNGKASQADLSTLSGQVTALTTAVNGKASKTDLNAVSGAVDLKASIAQLEALSGEIYGVIGNIEPLLASI